MTEESLAALRESEERYRLLTDHIPGLYSVISPEHTYIYVNLAYARQFGVPREQIVGAHMREVIGPLYDRVRDSIDEALLGEQQQLEVHLPRSPRGPRDLVGTLVPSRASDGSIDGVLALITDVTALRATERALARSREQIRLDHRVVSAFLTEDDRRAFSDATRFICEAMESPLGLMGYLDEAGDLVVPAPVAGVWSHIDGDHAPLVFKREGWSGLWGRALIERTTQRSSQLLRVPEGHTPLRCALAVPILDSSGDLFGLLMVANRSTDYDEESEAHLERIAAAVTPVLAARVARRLAEAEREALERQLLHAQKMEAVGRLAGGVAHDFNNLLQAIMGYGQLALDDLPTHHPLRTDLEQVLLAGERATALVRQLLLFSRRPQGERRAVDLSQLVAGLVRMLRRIIGEDIELEVEHGPGRCVVLADPGQLEQCVVNLCINARDAMPDGGRVTVAIGSRAVHRDEAQSHPWIAAGPHATLIVSDTGTGMTHEVRERVFEPFFTTKEVGKGTGLGLATVYGIVKEHDGLVDCETVLGQGTSFRISLPLVEAEQVSEEAPRPALQVTGGSETILLAEDDTQVRTLAVSVLRSAGYRVLAAVDGEAAVALFSDHADEVALAILDVVMPRVSGPDTCDRLREVRPDLPVLFASGYDYSLLNDRLTDDEREGLLLKPFTPAALLARVRRMLAD